MSSRDGALAALVDRLKALAKQRGQRLRVYPSTGERLRVEIDGEPYLVFLPTSKLELTPGRITQRVGKWPHIRGRQAAGYVILAKHADLSTTTIAADGRQLPPHVAVVGQWGSRDRIAASEIDTGIALILEAAGARRAEVRRLMNRPAEPVPETVADPVSTPQTDDPLEWGRSPRRGMLLDRYRLERRLGRGHSGRKRAICGCACGALVVLRSQLNSGVRWQHSSSYE